LRKRIFSETSTKEKFRKSTSKNGRKESLREGGGRKKKTHCGTTLERRNCCRYKRKGRREKEGIVQSA